MAEIIVNTKQFHNLQIQLSKLPKEIPSAQASALNRTLDFTVTALAKEVRLNYIIKARDIKQTLTKKKASKTDLNAYIKSRGHTLSLMKFKVNYKEPPKIDFGGKKAKFSDYTAAMKTLKPVKVQIKKKGSLKQIKSDPKAFVQKMNNNTAIWERKGGKRFPVVMLRSLSVPQMIRNNDVMTNINRLTEKKLRERIDHEIDFRLQKASEKLKS